MLFFLIEKSYYDLIRNTHPDFRGGRNPMTQDENGAEQGFPQYYTVIPPVAAMRVPVLYDPGRGNDILVYLKARTVVEVLARTELWLQIQLPGSNKGYIQCAYARLATIQEQQVLTLRRNARRRGITALPVSWGMAGSWKPGPKLGAAFTWFKLAIGCFSIGLLLDLFAVNTCQSGSTQCGSSESLATIALIVILASCICFVVSVIVGIVSILRYRMTR